MEKLEKQFIREQQKRIKPVECQKHVRLIVDTKLAQANIGPELLAELGAAGLNYKIRKLAANCIVWERSVGQHILQEENCVLNDEWLQEKQVVCFVNDEGSQRSYKDDSFRLFGKQLNDAYPHMSITLVVPKHNDRHGNLVAALIELQVLYQLNVVQLTYKVSEWISLLRRYTKAIAEAPYKEQRSKLLGGFKKYLANDKKQCVRVENGSGYGRLWQQHLNRLPLVTLEVAEAIIQAYPCPKNLLEHYKTEPKAIDTLADLKINRNGTQAVQNRDRRIGNVLSEKLYALYNCREPDTQL